jgi:beta-1,2-mannobiose phosphorylase / 1,2-beta-oligomannan phosphorylase
MNVQAVQRFDATVTRLGVVLTPDGSPNEADGVLNPASTRTRDGSLVLYPRVVGSGNVSRIGIARGIERGTEVHFERAGYALEPSAPYEVRAPGHGGLGCEDARVTFIAALDRYVMAYTAFGPNGPRIAVALSHDGLTWERLGLADFSAPGLPFGDDKDGAFFPEPVRSPNGVLSIAFYHRPMLRLSTSNGRAAIPTILDLAPENRESTRIAYVPLAPVYKDIRNLLSVAESALVLAPDGPWGKIKTGGGTPPIRIDEGWFSLYHGVDAVDVGGIYNMIYSAGIVVHDIDQPHKLVYRSPAPVMRPEGADELLGTVNNVVFPTAIDQRAERTFDVYYGMADAKIGRARCALAPAYAAAGENAA